MAPTQAVLEALLAFWRPEDTDTAFAGRAGIDVRTLRRWRKGDNPPSVGKIEDALDRLRQADAKIPPRPTPVVRASGLGTDEHHLARLAHDCAMEVARDGTEKERREFRRLISAFVANLGRSATDAGGADPSTATEFRAGRQDRRHGTAKDTRERRRSTDKKQRKTSRSTVQK